MVGSSVWRHLTSEGFTNLVGQRSSQLDLRDREAVFRWFDRIRPDVVIDAAARVGGILANSSSPTDFLSDNLRIQVNVMDAANRYDVDRLLFLGSACIYPKYADQPITEDSLLTGELEPTNSAYAIAKIAGVSHVQAVRTQYGRRWISAMPTNLYGPGDNFHPQTSHVLPALLRRFHQAASLGEPTAIVWGTGTPRREFLYVDDLAVACLLLLEQYDSPETINVGVGEDRTIQQLAEIVAEVTGFHGKIVQDPSMPDGTPRRLLDVSRLKALGWEPTTDLITGITQTYRWLTSSGSNRHWSSVRDPLGSP